MEEIKAGDRVVITAEAPASEVYDFVKEGLEGVVTTVHPSKDYPYSVEFEGDYVVDPRGCPVIINNPNLLFERAEIELKEK